MNQKLTTAILTTMPMSQAHSPKNGRPIRVTPRRLMLAREAFVRGLERRDVRAQIRAQQRMAAEASFAPSLAIISGEGRVGAPASAAVRAVIASCAPVLLSEQAI